MIADQNPDESPEKVDGIGLRFDLKLCRTYGALFLFNPFPALAASAREARLGPHWANLLSRLRRLDYRRVLQRRRCLSTRLLRQIKLVRAFAILLFTRNSADRHTKKRCVIYAGLRETATESIPHRSVSPRLDLGVRDGTSKGVRVWNESPRSHHNKTTRGFRGHCAAACGARR
jgi:hypothetical protein